MSQEAIEFGSPRPQSVEMASGMPEWLESHDCRMGCWNTSRACST